MRAWTAAGLCGLRLVHAAHCDVGQMANGTITLCIFYVVTSLSLFSFYPIVVDVQRKVL